MDITAIGLSFIEGLGLAASPCILPVLPFILGASVQKQWWRPFLIIAGFIGSFTMFSLLARQLLAATGVQQDAVQTGAYVLLLLFGLVMVVPAFEEKFAALTGGLANKAQSVQQNERGVLGALAVGGLIGLVWTPCAGPLLAAALLQIIQAKSSVEAGLSILAFAVGAGVPMLLVALFSQQLTTQIRALAKHAGAMRRVMGAIVIAFAVLSLSGFNIGVWVAEQQSKGEEVQLDGTRLENALSEPYSAPPIAGIVQWFNTEPVSLEELKGKVVLIDFWTYSCINCIRTLPHLKDWYAKYKDDGLVIIGVHAPEFAFEGQPDNVRKAVQKFGITYPVAMDNDFTTWNRFKNKYWPAHYLIDKAGNVVYTHFGEGHYAITENNIRVLLGLGKGSGAAAAPAVNTADDQTHETYLGTARAKNEATDAAIPLHHWKATGAWKRTAQFIESAQKGDNLTLHYKARKVFLVMESATGEKLSVTVTANGKQAATVDVSDGRAMVDASRLYELIEAGSAAEGTVSITADGPGLRLYAFTFEG